MTDGGSAARPISDYRPLEKVALPGIGAIKCEGLIVIVGPNSSGKSRFLQDVYAKLRGATQELVVATEIELAQIDHDGFVASLQAEGYISVYDDDSGNTQVKRLTIYLGAGEPIQAIPLTQAKNWYQEYAPSKGPKRRRTIDYLNYFGRMLVNALFLDRRLTGLGAAGMIDFENQPPQHDLHALWLNQKAQADLATEIRGSFPASGLARHHTRCRAFARPAPNHIN